MRKNRKSAPQGVTRAATPPEVPATTLPQPAKPVGPAPAPPSILIGSDGFRLLVESVKDYAIFMLDPGGRIISWNVGAERIKGYTAAEIVGKHFSIFYTEDAVQSRHPEHELEIAVREGRYEEEGWRVRKDGSQFWANVVITPLLGKDGTLQGFGKVTRDLTERRRTENQLRQARDDLERRVTARTEELSRANQILQAEVERRQRLEEVLRQQAEQLRTEARRKDEYLALLAHELRNPLGAVSNAFHVMSLAAPDSEAFQRAREVAARQIRHQTRMVDDLLDVSRITRGKVELRQERLDLRELLRSTLQDHESAVHAAGLSLSLELPEEAVQIFGDPVRVAQVVGNLLDNARKFTPEGGSVTVRLDVAPDSRMAVIRVRDTGPGIDPALLPRLFEPFAQASMGVSHTNGGLGLGLALVKGLTELHGGRVEAENAVPGQGSEFRVMLPLERTPLPAARPAAELRAPVRARVLVIEDIPDAALTLRDLLEVFGYEVELAHDGPAGLQKALEYRPDVVLCDIGLPGFDGYTVASELRQDPSMALTRLIAVTGYGTDDDRRRSQEAGFEVHLTKPVNPAELQQALGASQH